MPRGGTADINSPDYDPENDPFLQSMAGSEGGDVSAQARKTWRETHAGGGFRKEKIQGRDAWIGPDGQIQYVYEAHAVDPKLTQSQKQLSEQTAEFEKNMPRYSNELLGVRAQGEQRRLAQDLQKTQELASKRGLLYSGMRGAQEQQLRAETGSRLASAKSAINDDLSNRLNKMNQMTIESGLAVNRAERGLADATFAAALQNMQTGMKTYGALGSAIGQIGGAYFANRQQPQTDYLGLQESYRGGYDAPQETGFLTA